LTSDAVAGGAAATGEGFVAGGECGSSIDRSTMASSPFNRSSTLSAAGADTGVADTVADNEGDVGGREFARKSRSRGTEGSSFFWISPRTSKED